MANGRYRKKITVYVNNSTQEMISRVRFFGHKHYLVTHLLNNIDWRLTNERKTILGHPCRKAIGKRPGSLIDFKEKTIKKNTQLLVAWYAEDLPFSFGPEKFNGLPGVILEIIYSRFSYKASEINVNNKPVDKEIIKEPTEGIPITQSAWQEKMSKKIKGMMNKYFDKK